MKSMPRSAAWSSTALEAASSHWLPKIMVPRQRRLTLSPLRPSFTLPMRLAARGVVEEATAGLAAEVTLVDLLLEDPGSPAPALQAGPVLERAIEDVEAAEVEQLEGSHRPVEALLDRGVDVLGGRVAAFQQAHRLLGGGEQDAVDDEAVDLLVDEHRHPADAAHELHRRSHRAVRGLRSAHDFAQLHDRDRVEEMQVAAP